MKPTLLTLFILDLRLEHKEIHSISPLFLGIKESQGNVEVKTKEEEMRVKTKDERENLNRNPELLSLQWKKEGKASTPTSGTLSDQELIDSILYRGQTLS